MLSLTYALCMFYMREAAVSISRQYIGECWLSDAIKSASDISTLASALIQAQIVDTFSAFYALCTAKVFQA